MFPTSFASNSLYLCLPSSPDCEYDPFTKGFLVPVAPPAVGTVSGNETSQTNRGGGVGGGSEVLYFPCTYKSPSQQLQPLQLQEQNKGVYLVSLIPGTSEYRMRTRSDERLFFMRLMLKRYLMLIFLSLSITQVGLQNTRRDQHSKCARASEWDDCCLCVH